MQKKIHQPNQIRALLAIAKASFVATLRNPTAVFFNFFFPFIFISIFGVLDYSNATFDLGIRDVSLREGPLYEAIDKIDVLTLIEADDTTFDDQLNKGQIPAVISIREKDVFTLPNGSKQSTYLLELETSAADPQNAQTVKSILDGVVTQFNVPTDPNYIPLVTLNEVNVAGRKFEQIDFILPGQLAFALLTNALFGISFAFVTLRKELVIKRIFATPARRWTILGGEVLSRVIMAILQAVLIILVGHYVFGFTLSHGFQTFLAMLVLSLVGIIVFLSMGLLVPSIGKDENSISPIANLIMMPQLFLSGAFFPIEAFPKFIQPIASHLPMTYLNDAFKVVAFEGAALADTLPMITGLLIWGTIIYLIDIKLFKWE